MKDNDGKEIPDKLFVDCQQNTWNLSRAKKYLKQVQSILKNKIQIQNWNEVDTIYKIDKQGVDEEHLPKYINITFYKGVKCGYVVNGYPLPNNKKSCKKFTNSKFTMEERYNMAIKYLEELKVTHPLAK